MKDRDKKLVKSLESVNKLMLEMKRECENYRLVESVSPFAVKLMNLLTQMERYLEERAECRKCRAAGCIYGTLFPGEAVFGNS